MNVDVPRLLLALGIDAKRKGRNWTALCPFHVDTKPSWDMRDQQGHERHARHHCFACKAGGTAASLVKDLLNLEDYAAAHEWLSDNGITTDPDTPVDVDVETRLGGFDPDRSTRVPLGVVFAPLSRWVSSARAYAVKRGITDAQVDKWGLGYAIDGRCVGRIFVPIRDEEGVLLSYTARSYTGGDIRYLTPRREEGLRTDAVFGMAEWKDRTRVVVTEGALNALACERAGALQIGALGGSEVTPSVIAEVSAFDRITILTDADAAGDSAALQLYFALARWRNAERLRIGPGPDGRKRDANDLTVDELRAMLGT